MNELVKVSPELQTGIERMESWARALVVVNTEQRTTATNALRDVKAKRKEIEDFFAPSRESAHAAWKAIVANIKSFTDRLDFIERAGKQAVRKYDDEEEAKRLAEQRRLQALADEKARKERERLEKEAAKLKTPELKQQRLDQAAAVVAPVVNVPAPEKVKGEATRKTWKARVVDVTLVPREYMTVNQKALDAFALATKGAVKLAGCEMYEESTLAIGGR